MNCLVLGGAGFIGSHIVATLTQSGHTVRLLARHPNPIWQAPKMVECVWADWQDERDLSDVLQDVECVIHLISATTPATANADMLGDVYDNLNATIRLLQLCQAQQVRKIVYASSGGTVYGVPQEWPIPENHATHPICAYGIVKLAIEKYIQLFHHLYGLQYAIIRGSNPYGERQNPTRGQGAVSAFLGRLARGTPIEIWGDGQVIRDYVYVGDLARAFRLAVESPRTTDVFNVGSGSGLSLLGLLTQIQQVTGLTPAITYQPARAMDVPINILNIQHIRATLGWEPTTTLSDGLQHTWEWVKTHTP